MMHALLYSDKYSVRHDTRYEYTEQVPPHTGKKTVLVTGAAGFIGSWVADTLLARGDDVVIVDEVRVSHANIGHFLDSLHLIFPHEAGRCGYRARGPTDVLLSVTRCRGSRTRASHQRQQLHMSVSVDMSSAVCKSS